MTEELIYTCSMSEAEYQLLMKMLHQIGYNSYREKYTRRLVSSCTFVFDSQIHATDTFNTLYYKLRDLAASSADALDKEGR